MARRRVVRTIEGIVDVLGGNKAAAALLGVTPPMMTYWRHAGRFPARALERIQAELARKGAVAVRDLFDFDPPRTYDETSKRAIKRA
jgi:DNA-binding transcriptional regulator YdaS (Cro superfamily)